MVNTCFICKKRSDKTDLSFHRFPSNSTHRQEWLNILAHIQQIPGKRASICSRHFDSKCFRYGLVYGKEFLKPGSKPTLYLRKDDQPSEDQPRAIITSNETDGSNTTIVSNDCTSVSVNEITNISDDELLSDLQTNPEKNKDEELVVELSPAKPTILKKRKQETPPSEVISYKRVRLTKITWEEFCQSSKGGEILWEVAKQQLINHKTKMEGLQRTVRRLKQKVSSLKLMTKYILKKGALIKKEALHVESN